MEIPSKLRGFKFCRIRKGTKKPFERDWTNKPYSYEEIKPFLEKEQYGILCGYENLAVIDCDKPELQSAIECLLPITFRVKTGGDGMHNYFIIKDLRQKLILETETGEHLGEIQSVGTQVVGPNSIHPNKKKYDVILDVPIKEIPAEKLFETLNPFIRKIKDTEETANCEREIHSEIDNLSVVDIWGLNNMKKQGSEYYGSHPIHGSEGGMNFWINPTKNLWHCFRCDSGGGPLSAIAVKEGIIECSEAQKGILRGQKAREALKIAEEKYGLIKESVENIKENEEKDFEFLWDDDLKNYKEEEKEWIIDRLIPSRSVCILTGKRGTLKTFIALLIGYSIATGTNFLGRYETKKGKVIYLDKENGIPIMRKRTSMIKNGLQISQENIKVGFICFSQLKIDKMSDIGKIESLIKKHNPSLLIVDTYRRGISFDENDAGAVSELFVDTLRPLVEKNNISIILIHHNRKTSGKSGDEMDEIRGSSDLANYADIIFKTEGQGKNIIFKQLKNRNAAEEPPIKIKTEFNEEKYVKMTYEGEYSKQTQTDKCAEAILVWVSENGLKEFRTKDIKEMALEKGFKKNSLHNALIELQSAGAIENIGFGIYKIPQDV